MIFAAKVRKKCGNAKLFHFFSYLCTIIIIDMKKTFALLALLLLIGISAARADEKKFALYGIGFY
ncbi:MAG: hypothetical protein K2O54_01045, partial [Prevotella sp.]|nr:hypothetical protein [Prevotella sp.]